MGESAVEVVTLNVNELTLEMPPGWCPLEPAQTVLLSIDSVEIPVPRPRSDRSWYVHLVKKEGVWERPCRPPDPGNGRQPDPDLRPDQPIPSLQPEDPTPPQAARPPGADRRRLHGLVRHRQAHRRGEVPQGRRVGQEPRPTSAGHRALADQFRGEARVKDDSAVTDADIASSNLVLWGDPESNAVLKRIADKLPIRWEGGQGRRRQASRSRPTPTRRS